MKKNILKINNLLITIIEVFILLIAVVLAIYMVIEPKSNLQPPIILCTILLLISEFYRRKNLVGKMLNKECYMSNDEKIIVMVQSYADRKEWGTVYHCLSPKSKLRKIIKIFGDHLHPVSTEVAKLCVNTSIEKIVKMKPDIVGIGGKGKTASLLESKIKNHISDVKIEYWGKDVGIDACGFLMKQGVKPPY